MIIHVFGAIFGLVAGRILFTKHWRESEHLGSVYHSDILTFIGNSVRAYHRISAWGPEV